MSSLVMVQTIRGNAGIEAALKAVQDGVTVYNKANPQANHKVVHIEALPSNVKGMQWQLALIATLARKHEATMIRLSVHNAQIALCGPAKAIEAVQKEVATVYNDYMTLMAATFNPAVHGNKVGFSNGFLCGCPAGLQDALNLRAELRYGVGFLFAFPAPGSGDAYNLGYEATKALVAPAKVRPAAKPRAAAKPRVAKEPVVEQPVVELTESVAAAA